MLLVLLDDDGRYMTIIVILMSDKGEKVRVIVQVKRVWLAVRFNCKLSFIIKNGTETQIQSWRRRWPKSMRPTLSSAESAWSTRQSASSSPRNYSSPGARRYLKSHLAQAYRHDDICQRDGACRLCNIRDSSKAFVRAERVHPAPREVRRLPSPD